MSLRPFSYKVTESAVVHLCISFFSYLSCCFIILNRRQHPHNFPIFQCFPFEKLVYSFRVCYRATYNVMSQKIFVNKLMDGWMDPV